MNITAAHDLSEKLCGSIGKEILGKREEIRLVVAALLAEGHVLLEDVPGTGKTMLAKALAKSIDCEFGRAQFTPDLLPGELTGISFYNPKDGEFSFRPGALFANILLADEINRATPRTQSGLLESMEERQVSVDGITHPLPVPYFVIATQNPVETQGTFPLPEAQLDRFMIRLSLGYPVTEQSVEILRKNVTALSGGGITAVCGGEEILAACAVVRKAYIHDEVYLYITALAEATRAHEAVALGASTRACIALARMAQARAVMDGRDYVTPDDVKPLVSYVFAHRLLFRAGRRGVSAEKVLTEILGATDVPVEDWKLRGSV